ncbi:Membrane protein involved in the export of O-antigen and teichoic acid [Chryseobacterium formosense]|uniref:lipopolysaccharide biosynthesis protein n=1 Tax=Chryseobacterium formosense TaxID=236814 RepID=UPI00068C3F64|nr:lipopolysaccharide biosynthesis protein [Chryseobacterium formosense]SFT33117.1 Membrane protein involved in the export of O-antigen and teichoic acid [Chryseobacterium formosense]
MLIQKIKNSRLLIGLFWSSIEKVGIIAIQFILEIILARLLNPSDYGLLGMIAVIMGVAQTFVDGGFTTALLQKKDRTENDYSTVFIFTLFLGILSYCILLLSSSYISEFYNKDLNIFITVMGLSLLFNSLGSVFRVNYMINLNFKIQAKISLISILLSGIIGVFLAYHGYGVWALIIQTVSLSFFTNLFLIIVSNWFPKFNFSVESFNSLFGFGIKVFFSSIIQSIYINITSVILGKFYKPATLGYFTKANQLTIFPTSVFTGIIQRVLFPYLTEFQNDNKILYANSIKNIKFYCLFGFPIITILFIFSEDVILLILGSHWIGIVSVFKILLLSCAFYPMIIMNMNIIQIKGKMNLFLIIEITTKLIGLMILFFTYKLGLVYIAYGILLQFFLQFIISSFSSLKLMRSGMTELFGYVFLMGLLCFMVYFISYLSNQFYIHEIARMVLCVFLCIIIIYAMGKNQFRQILNK